MRDASRVRSYELGIALLLFVSTFLLFSPVRKFEFLNFDDNEYVTENSYVNSGLHTDNIIWAFTHSHSGHWHPLTWMSHMLDVRLFGMNPGAHHLVNVGFHAANTALMFFLVFRLTGMLGLSAFCAALFGFHPMRLESVAWIAERKDVLSIFFGLITCLAYLCYSNQRTVSRYLLVVVFFALGLLAKPMLVTFPILFLLFDYFLGFATTRILEKIPLLFLSLGSSIAVIYAQQASGGYKSLADTALADRFSNAFVGYLGYFGKLFWPSGGGIFYPLVSYPPGVGAGALFCLTLLTMFCVYQRKDRPYLLFGWLWFLVSLLPVIGFVQVGGQALADRWTYLPHIGPIIACSLFLREQLKKTKWRSLVPLFAIIPLLGCVWITHARLPHWKDSESIFRYTLEVSPNNFMAHTNLGAALDVSGREAEAAEHYEEAARLNPGYPQALNNVGILRARSGDLNAAIILFRKVIAIQPGNVAAHYNLGIAYSAAGDNLRSASELVAALIQNPSYLDAANSFDIVLSRLQAVNCEGLRVDSTAHHQLSVQELSLAVKSWRPLAPHVERREALLHILSCFREIS